MHWREEQITAAGGSVEQARSRAKADGRDFDDLVQEQYRVEMRRIYFQKKEFPKVQISAQDMRQYYADHQDQFSTRSEAKFDLIKITFDASGGREKALARITAIRDRIQRGEDFSVIAGVENDADDLRNSKGDAGFGDWIERGAFANQQVEDAVWQVQPGQMTPIIEGPNAFFLAKMIQRKDGQSRSFADADVQALIRRALEAEQFEALRDKVLNDLESQAIVSPNPPDYQPVIEMAMQMYPIWRK
jgi:peptidyl-prolyl cis-trans isomerase D